jgi:tetratricopeptide (TPR) repeat protein
MTLQIPNDHRRMIPRWRNSWIAVATGELLLSRSKKLSPVKGLDKFQKKLRLWLEKRTIENASDVVSAGLSQGYSKEAVDAAEFLMENSTIITPTVLSIANEVLTRAGKKNVEEPNTPITFEKQQLYSKIHDFRKGLIEYPRNPLMWVDLSRAYTVIGEWSKASSAMVRALIIAPQNRFVLRSAARLYIHVDDPHRAHDILSKSENIQTDPWLLAAEIATATVAGVKSKFLRNSHNILDREIYHPFDTSELAGALATLELFDGSSKKARKLFQVSLRNPTENSVAQSAWAKRWLPTLELGTTITTTPRTYEARAWHAYLALDWGGVIAASTDWLLDEPFSSRPADFGSYAALVGFDNYELAENIIRNALIANPDDHSLINNYVFALANQDKLVEALAVLKTINRPVPNTRDEAALRATEGLIDVRLGNIKAGQTKYLDAISLASKEAFDKVAALASIYYAREMAQNGEWTLSDAINFAERASSKFHDPDVIWLVQKLKSLPQNQQQP